MANAVSSKVNRLTGTTENQRKQIKGLKRLGATVNNYTVPNKTRKILGMFGGKHRKSHRKTRRHNKRRTTRKNRRN